MPRLATARRTAALAAAVGLALATAGCGTGTGQSASGGTTSGGTTSGSTTSDSTTSGSPEPSAAVTGGPTELPTFDPSSAVATYAQGFPADLFPMPEDATLLASSAQPAPASEGAKKAKAVAMTQVTLNLSSSRKTDQVIKQAKQILTAQGFKQISAPDASGLTAQTAFLRITKGKSGEVQESLVVGVLDDGERRLCSISGTVRTP
ncbi:hypothetical protein [Promicromonospora sukumoe]|uniref:hypothetical protein n=1 Tax=Promicromonospora sukumoe TaxID=88382 RepID=UPI0036497D5D